MPILVYSPDNELVTASSIAAANVHACCLCEPYACVILVTPCINVVSRWAETI